MQTCPLEKPALQRRLRVPGGRAPAARLLHGARIPERRWVFLLPKEDCFLSRPVTNRRLHFRKFSPVGEPGAPPSCRWGRTAGWVRGAPPASGSPNQALSSARCASSPCVPDPAGPRRLLNVLCHVSSGALPGPLLSSFQLISH